MKKSAYLFILLYSAISLSFVADNKSEVLQAITKKVAGINNYKDYKVKTKKADCLPGPTCKLSKELTAYIRDKKVDRITESISSTFGKTINEYYFDSEKLIYTLSREESFDDDGTQPQGSIMRPEFTGQYYFDKGKLIDFREEGSKRFDVDKEETSDEDVINLPAKEQELLESAYKYLRMLKK